MKTCYVDVETAGTDPGRHALLQVAMIIDIDGEVIATKVWNLSPFETDQIDDQALVVNKIDRGQLFSADRIDPRNAFTDISAFLGEQVDKFDKTDKLTFAAYNARFDNDFLRQFWLKCGDKYFGSWFSNQIVDPLQVVYFLRWLGQIPPLPDYKLGTVCANFGISIENAHDALADIKATRALAQILRAHTKFSMLEEGGDR